MSVDETLYRLGRRIGRPIPAQERPTTGTVTQISYGVGRVIINLTGTEGDRPMRYSSSFGRALAESGRALEGELVMVAFLDSGEPFVVDLIIGSPILDGPIED